jgi:hypothetical protein
VVVAASSGISPPRQYGCDPRGLDHAASIATRGSSWAPSEERVAVDVEGARLVLTGCLGEGVDGRSDRHTDESDVFEHLLPARTGQPAGYSAGPEIDVA